MMKKQKKLQPSPVINSTTVGHVAQLARIPITKVEEQALTKAFEETLAYIDNLKTLNVTNVEPTNQVTGLENVWREDEALDVQTFTQAQALANAHAVHKGYFVVDRLIDQE